MFTKHRGAARFSGTGRAIFSHLPRGRARLNVAIALNSKFGKSRRRSGARHAVGQASPSTPENKKKKRKKSGRSVRERPARYFYNFLGERRAGDRLDSEPARYNSFRRQFVVSRAHLNIVRRFFQKFRESTTTSALDTRRGRGRGGFRSRSSR